MPLSSSSPPGSLDRRLGPLDAAAIVIANVIGVGIFITPGVIAQAVPHPAWILGVWVGGGLLAFAGAMAYAELAALRPRSGGEYVYLREAFGPLAAFLTGWTSFVAGFAGAIAAAALSVGSYLGRFIPAASDATPILAVPLGPVALVVSRQSLVALTAIVGLAYVHLRGLGPGRLVQNTLASVKIGALAVFVALGLSLGNGSLSHVTAGPSTAADIGIRGVAFAMLLIMFTYSGWNAASYVAEEIRDPGRNAPIALAVGTGVVVLIYLGLNLLYLYALPVDKIVGLTATPDAPPVANAAAQQLLGATASSLVGALAVLILLSSLSAMTVAGPRVYYAMARDGVFFRSAAEVHPRFHTPWIAILAQSGWSVMLVLLNWTDAAGRYRGVDLPSYTGFAVLLFSGFAVTAVFILRWRYPNEPRPFRAWGYPIAPAIFALASLGIMVFSFLDSGPNAVFGLRKESLWGLLIMGAGIPLYLWTRRQRASRDSASREAPRA